MSEPHRMHPAGLLGAAMVNGLERAAGRTTRPRPERHLLPSLATALGWVRAHAHLPGRAHAA